MCSIFTYILSYILAKYKEVNIPYMDPVDIINFYYISIN